MLTQQDITPADVERFLSRIDRQPTGCWEWHGERNNHGYGRFETHRSGRRRYLAHRLMLALTTGADLAGLSVRHTCDNPPCVRPDHLLTGSHADNMRDAMERQRMDLSGLTAHRDERDARMRARIAMGIKRCPHCGSTKSLDDFHRKSDAPDGRQGECKSCGAQRKKARRRVWELTS